MIRPRTAFGQLGQVGLSGGYTFGVVPTPRFVPSVLSSVQHVTYFVSSQSVILYGRRALNDPSAKTFLTRAPNDLLDV